MRHDHKRSPATARHLVPILAGLAAAAVLAGCAPEAVRPPVTGAVVGTPWLERLSYGLNGSTLAEYRRLGRSGFVDAQLADRPAPLPAAVESQIESLEISHVDSARLLEDVNAENKRINASPTGPTGSRRARRSTSRATGSRTRPRAGSCCGRSTRATNCANRWSGSGSIISASIQ